MKLKNSLHFAAWSFHIGEDDNEIRIPAEGFVKSRKLMVSTIIATLEALAKQGESGYLQRAKEEAESMGLSLIDYTGRILEHQICLRSSNPSSICLPSGIGDKIHSFIVGVEDSIERAPSPIKTVGKTLIRKSIQLVNKNKKATTARGCGSCGGTKTFTKSAWNFGRAGRMQKK